MSSLFSGIANAIVSKCYDILANFKVIGQNIVYITFEGTIKKCMFSLKLQTNEAYLSVIHLS